MSPSAGVRRLGGFLLGGQGNGLLFGFLLLCCGKPGANADVERLKYFAVRDEHHDHREEEGGDLHQQVIVHAQFGVVLVGADAQQRLVFPSVGAVGAEEVDLDERDQEGEERDNPDRRHEDHGPAHRQDPVGGFYGDVVAVQRDGKDVDGGGHAGERHARLVEAADECRIVLQREQEDDDCQRDAPQANDDVENVKVHRNNVTDRVDQIGFHTVKYQYGEVAAESEDDL